MSGFTRVFDALDLEIMDRVYEVVWAQVEARKSPDAQPDDELKETLRKLVMTCAANGKVEFDSLYDKVWAGLSEYWGSAVGRRARLIFEVSADQVPAVLLAGPPSAYGEQLLLAPLDRASCRARSVP